MSGTAPKLNTTESLLFEISTLNLVYKCGTLLIIEVKHFLLSIFKKLYDSKGLFGINTHNSAGNIEWPKRPSRMTPVFPHNFRS